MHLYSIESKNMAMTQEVKVWLMQELSVKMLQNRMSVGRADGSDFLLVISDLQTLKGEILDSFILKKAVYNVGTGLAPGTEPRLDPC